ncbi:peptidoglycan synthetase [bacterium AH-315-C07]|nr:peptidoglycan synthetase [bacterium AH-315-C07]
MKIHFIAIGGAVMHNFAICLKNKGLDITGSDDEIFDPAKSRLADNGLLPDEFGWFADKITQDLDGVILGMHARENNPELLKAQELGIRIYSFPEYVFEQSKKKKRVVIGGSHGKTSITSMIMHVLKFYHNEFDYLVGAQIEGFDTMVSLTDAPVIILEGDEYLSSTIDKRPKFHLYKPHIALLSGIAWDHINVFPTFENYKDQFIQFIETIESEGCLIYCKNDSHLKEMCSEERKGLTYLHYSIPDYVIIDGTTHLRHENGLTPITIIGDHNLLNLQGAMLVCNQLGISDESFHKAISSFKGAARRLELMANNEHSAYYKDFAHSPSKLKATIGAVKHQYPDRQLLACMELHTFSSLNKDFLAEYGGCMKEADEAIVYFNPKTVEHKKLESIDPQEIKDAFGEVEIYTDSKELFNNLKAQPFFKRNLLMMSSGNFDDMKLEELSNQFES